MGLVNLGVFRGVETHRGVEGDDCASSLTTRFFSLAGLPAAKPRESRVRLRNRWVEVRRDNAEGSERLIVSLGRGQQGLLHA